MKGFFQVRLLIPLAVIALSVGIYTFFQKEHSPADPAVSSGVGVQAPGFTLKDVQGNEVTLSQFKGKVVFLNFWATWCPACRIEMPSMERLHETFSDQNFTVLTVNVDQDTATVKDFTKENSHSFPVLLDPDGRVQRIYGVFRLPETFLIDPSGAIVEHYLGARDWSSNDFLAKVRSMLEK